MADGADTVLLSQTVVGALAAAGETPWSGAGMAPGCWKRDRTAEQIRDWSEQQAAARAADMAGGAGEVAAEELRAKLPRAAKAAVRAIIAVLGSPAAAVAARVAAVQVLLPVLGMPPFVLGAFLAFFADEDAAVRAAAGAAVRAMGEPWGTLAGMGESVRDRGLAETEAAILQFRAARARELSLIHI